MTHRALLLTTLTLVFASRTFAEATPASASDPVKEDIGDIHPASEASPGSYFHGGAQVRGVYTSNAKLRGNHGSSDFLTMPTLEGGFTAPMGRGFDLDVLARAESTIYSRFDERGFWGFSGQANIDYRFKPSWPRVYVGTEAYRYNSFDNNDNLASAVSLQTGVDQGVSLNRGKTLLFAGYNFSHYFAFPEVDTRNTHRLTVSLTQQIRPALYGQVFYQWQYSSYEQQGDRGDSRHAVGLNLIYQFRPNVFGSVNTAFVDNNSTRAPASYQNVTAGVGVTWQF